MVRNLIGFVTGSGPGTGDYFLRLLSNELSVNQPVVIYNVPYPIGGSVKEQQKAIDVIKGLGCSHICILCNSAHKTKKHLDFRGLVFIDLISMACKYIKTKLINQDRVGILTYDNSTTISLYQDNLCNIDLVAPLREDGEIVTETILMARKEVSNNYSSINARLLKITVSLKCNYVIAGCTDLPYLLHATDTPSFQVIDSQG
jgi:aspartate/glutamate racemase